jgi:signal peptidase I
MVENKNNEKTKKNKSVGREYAEAIIIAVVAAFLIRGLVVQAFKIPSGSMKPTLQIGDHILVSKFIYRFTEPKRGDVIVFKYPRDERKDFIKRVVGLPGERVEMRGTTVYINGEPLKEEYARYNGNITHRNNFGPVRVPDGHLFVMGDNRDNSKDSRYWGFLDIKKIKGKAFLIYFSWNRRGDFLHKVRWARVGDLIR